MIKNTLKLLLLKTPVVCLISLLVFQGFALGQNRSDSLAVFEKKLLKDPVLYLETLKRYSVQVRPQAMINPELDLFGPSDLIPTYGQRFIPSPKLSFFTGGNHDRDILGGFHYQNPAGFQFVDLKGSGFWINEGNYTRREASGSFLTGNNQLNTDPEAPDVFFVFSVDGHLKQHHPHDKQTDSTTVRVLNAGVEVFSDPMQAGNQWGLVAGYSDFFTDGRNQFETGTVTFSGQYRYDFSFLNWVSSVNGWAGTGIKRSSEQAVSAETGFEFQNEQIQAGVTGGYFIRNGLTRSEKSPAGTATFSFHTRQTHQKLTWNYVVVQPGFDELLSDENWISTGDFAALDLLSRHRIDYSFEWIPTKNWIYYGGTRFHQAEDRIAPDSTGKFSVVRTSSHRIESRLSWIPVLSTTLTAGFKKELYFGEVKSLPFKPGEESFFEVAWLTLNQKNRITGRVRYHTKRYFDTLSTEKLPNYTDISLKIEDFHWFALNFFVEFKIIANGHDQFYPGLIKKERQYFAGLSYNL